ncbi:MAG: prepilin peptidase [Candidatus Taylorbacteria bacterium]|nr:prepilin peptidase [Candidatus Taylorbacteria bacterium]
MAVFYILIFLVGLCVGSFLNVLLFRLDRKDGILMGRSECRNCLHQLHWYDLIPLVSYLYLGGNCRYCKAKISIIYPLVELTAGLAVFSYFWVNNPMFGISGTFPIVFIVLFLLLIFFDALYLILPDKIVFTAIGVALVYDIIFRKPDLPNLLLSGFLFSLAFAIIYLVSRGEWMGFGDVKLVFAIGLVLGYPLGLFSVMTAIWIAALWGVVLLLLKKATRKTALPFGSFLSASAIIFIIFQNVITEKITAYFFF